MSRISAFLLLSLTLFHTPTVWATSVILPLDSEAGENYCTVALKDLQKLANREAVFKERFIQPLESFAKELQKAKNSRQATLDLIHEDFRQFIFRVETLAHFYQDAPWGKGLKEVRMNFKALEDLLGATVDAHHLVKEAIKTGMPQAVIQLANEDADLLAIRLETLLINGGWLENPAEKIKDVIKVLQKMDAPTQEEDAKFIEKQLQKQAQEILDAHYDMGNLEEMHKERRELRKLAITIITLRGKIQIVQGLIPESLKPFQGVAEEAKKYLVIDETGFDLKHWVRMSEGFYKALSYMVNKFGEFKDRGELHLTLRNLLVRSGVYSNEKTADRWLIPQLKKTVTWEDFTSDAWKTHQELVRSDLLHLITL